MPTSAKRPQDRKKKQRARTGELRATSARAWKKSGGVGETFTLPLPSGNVATVTRPGLESMLTSGDIPDSLLGLAQASIDKGQGKKTEAELDDQAVADIAEDPSKWLPMLDAVDRIAARLIVEPKVEYAKWQIDGSDEWEVIPEEDRFEGILYTDELSLDDKFFVFDFACGDSADLERFHAEHAGRVERVLDRDEVQGSSE